MYLAEAYLEFLESVFELPPFMADSAGEKSLDQRTKRKRNRNLAIKHQTEIDMHKIERESR